MRSTDLVLVCGHDLLLLETRRMILEREGFLVRLASQVVEARTQLENEDIQIVILCQTLSNDEVRDILKSEAPAPLQRKFIVLSPTLPCVEPPLGFDYFGLDHSPRLLVEAVRLLSQQQEAS